VRGLVLLAVLLPALAAAAPVPEERPPFTQKGDPATFDVVGGGSPEGAWAIGASGGYPWSSLRGQLGMRGGLTPLVSLETALFRRWEPTLGVSGRILDRPRGRLSAEVQIGWTIVTGEVPKNGPRALARLRLMGILGRVAPWLSVATGHTVYVDETIRVTATGEESELSARHEWAPVIEAGVAVAITKHVGLELGFDWHFVGAPDRFALPGLHLGVQVGAGKRPPPVDVVR
jgi:hypothetical protein